MSGLKRERGEAKPPLGREPNWALLSEKAIIIDIDFAAIVNNDPKKLLAQAPTRGKYLEMYQNEIIGAAIAELQKIRPGASPKRSVLSGSRGTTYIAGIDALSVFMTFSYSQPDKPTLKVKVMGEGDEQARLADGMRAVKKSFEPQ